MGQRGELIKKLKEYDQLQLLDFYEELSAIEKEKLLSDISEIDFSYMKNLYENIDNTEIKNPDNKFSPVDYVAEKRLSAEIREKYTMLGLESIQNGEVIAVTMAGGQGTRLGHSGPKGTYDIGLPTHKAIFQLHCEYLKGVSERAGNFVKWYIMTSHINNDETVDFFKKNNFFGYPEDKIAFFIQPTIPSLTKDGKLMLSEKYEVLKAPNGNGGVFAGMVKNKIIENEKKAGVKYAFICGVDNVLVKLCDPEFIGYLIDSGCEAVTKTVLKSSPHEKVGVYCMKNGRPAVVEYTELTEEMANAKNDVGDYTYGDANIVNYAMRLDAIEDAINKGGLRYHTSVKKMTYVDKNGEKVTSKEPDTYKFELFIFDIFEQMTKFSVFRIAREEEFAPVKNKEGEDSPETARALYMACVKNGTRKL